MAINDPNGPFAEQGVHTFTYDENGTLRGNDVEVTVLVSPAGDYFPRLKSPSMDFPAGA